MKITAPYGYDEIVPLRKTHRVLMPAGSTPAFGRARSFAPVVVLGLDEGENLFVDASGEWDRSAYFPAFVRRHPFCISKLYVDGEPRSERVVCVAKAYVDDSGVQ